MEEITHRFLEWVLEKGAASRMSQQQQRTAAINRPRTKLSCLYSDKSYRRSANPSKFSLRCDFFLRNFYFATKSIIFTLHYSQFTQLHSVTRELASNEVAWALPYNADCYKFRQIVRQIDARYIYYGYGAAIDNSRRKILFFSPEIARLHMEMQRIADNLLSLLNHLTN